MLQRIAPGVHVHVSEFIQTPTTVVEGRDGVLLVDPGITNAELVDLADDLERLGKPVVAAFSTHPHWDHVLWHPRLGDAPRYATPGGAAYLRDLLAMPDWREQIAEGLPPEHADDIPMELLGEVTALPPGTTLLPWDRPDVRVIEHDGHEHGSAVLLIEDAGVLVAGDMLSDTLMPFLNLQADDPLGDYAAALDRFEELADEVRVVVPGHGSVGGADALRERLRLDRAYLDAVRSGREPEDPRLGPGAPLEWLPQVDAWQRAALADKLG